MTMTEINHQLEAVQATEAGHDLACLEIAAEQVVEAAAEAGISYRTGSFDEVIGKWTVLEHAMRRLLTGQSTCECETEEEA